MTHIPSLARTLLGLLFITCFIFFLRYPNLTNSDILFTSNYETMARRSYIKDFKIIKNKKKFVNIRTKIEKIAKKKSPKICKYLL